MEIILPFIEINGANIYYNISVTDRPGRAPIVLIHGSTITGQADWHAIAPLLATEYRVIVPDCRGHGQSSNPNLSYSFKEMAGDMAALIRALGYEPGREEPPAKISDEERRRVLDELDQAWLPVEKSWKLNERHYGALQGLDKAATKEKYGVRYEVLAPDAAALEEHHVVPPLLQGDRRGKAGEVEQLLLYKLVAKLRDRTARFPGSLLVGRAIRPLDPKAML